MPERRALLALALAGLAAAAAWGWLSVPRTPAALYRARCGACHALPDLCAYPADLRTGIVEIMRTRHGADQVIGDAEASAISRYIREELPCP